MMSPKLMHQLTAPFAAAWVAALAFTRPPRWRAVLASPLFTLGLIQPWLVGGLYVSREDGKAVGTVTVAPHRPWADKLMMVLIVSLPIAALTAVITLLGLPVNSAMLFATIPLALVAVGYLVARPTPPRLQAPVDEYTPPGRRVVIANLAQRPGTQLNALLLVRSAVRGLRSGTVLVAVAADDDLLKGYVRLGFTHTTDRRVYKVL